MAWEPQTELPGGFADEAGLVAALRAGRSEAFEALHAAYAPRIYNLALRIVDDQEEAQDVAQEVLLKVFRGLPDNETDLNLPAWLYRVTVNTAFDHVRARKRRPVTVAEEAAPEITAAVDEYERAELARRVESSLRQLPKRQQLALVLRDVNGLSVGETASVLGLTKGSADVLLSRARAGFRRVFLAGAGSLTGRCDRADRVLAACVGRGERVPAALLEHSRTCSDCRRAVRFWGAAPVGLGLLLPQVALPAKLSLGATLAAAHAAGIALPAGLGAAGASAAASGASAAGAAGAAAGAAAAEGAAAASAGGAGLLAALVSATGVKVATLAAVATTVVGIAGVSAQRAHTSAGLRQRPTGQVQSAGMAAQGGHPGGDGSGLSPREHALLVSRAHRSGPAAGWSEGGGPRSAGSGGAGTRVGRTGASVSAGGGQSRSGDVAGSAVGSTHSNGTTGGSGSGSGGQGSGSDGGQSTRGSGSGGDAGRSGAAGSGGGQPGDHGSGSSGGKFSQE